MDIVIFFVVIFGVPPFIALAIGTIKELYIKYKERKMVEWQKNKYCSVRSDAADDMSNALFKDIRSKITSEITTRCDKGDIDFIRKWSERQNIYRKLVYLDYDGPNDEDLMVAIGEMIWNYEIITKSVYNFDLSLGQKNKDYLGSEDENEYQAYINGGLLFMDKVDKYKIGLIERRDRMRRRSGELDKINKRWSTVNEELTRLRNTPVEIDAKKAFDKELNS